MIKKRMIKNTWPVLLACLVLLPIVGIAEDNDTQPKDFLAPQSHSEDALTGALHTITVSTNSLEESLLFYRDGNGLTVTGPIKTGYITKRRQRKLWDIPRRTKWDLYLLHRKGVPGTIQIRLLVLHKRAPAIHRSWSALELGPFSMGWPNLQPLRQDEKLRQLGFGSLNKIEVYPVPRPDGSNYLISETIFNAPDFVHGVSINRGDGMTQLGPIDPKSGLGGPAYSAQIIEDSDRVLAFYTDVLGLELRSDRTWTTRSEDSALAVPPGTVFRFSIVYAKGAASGHLLFVDYKNRATIAPNAEPRVPNLGIGMWSFPTRSLETVLDRAREKNIEIVRRPTRYKSPALGDVRAATLLAPNGFLVEIFEPKEF